VIPRFGDRSEQARRPSRFVVFGIVVALCIGTLTARMFYLQVASGAQLIQPAAQSQTELVPIPAPRGLIEDRAGRDLVTNVRTFSVKIRPADLPNSARDTVVARLAALTRVDAASINEAIDGNPGSTFDLVRVARDVDEQTAGLIAEARFELPGVHVVVEPRRSYPEGALFAQILGYTGPVSAERYVDLRELGYQPDDLIGQAGLEAQYERELRGTYGAQLVEKDVTGRQTQVLRTVREAAPGATLRLTIDQDVQQDAETALRWALDTIGSTRGVVIAMNPQTGEILAMVSLPTYDNNLFAQGISEADFAGLLEDKDTPLLNHAIQAHYAPGSTYKLVTGTGALGDKEITASTQLMTKSFLTLGPTKFFEWNGRGWGLCDIFCGFGHSSDTFFYQLAGMLGADRLGYWANQYGFGAPTGVDLPGEVAGIVPTNEWKQQVLGAPMFGGETYQAGIGQGYDAVTPLQLINAYAALANGGTLYQPQVVREVIGPDGSVRRPFAPIVSHAMDVRPSVLRTMRRAARETVLLRHTYNLVDLPIKVAGKSGTSEFGKPDAKGRLPYSSWFVGFTPKDPYKGSIEGTDSELVVMAFAHDSRTVGNAATEIVKYFLQLHYDLKVDLRLPELLERGNFYTID
jgi:penicillin-binding protein 2